MAIDPSHPRPKYHNRGLYIAVMLRRRSGMGPPELFGVVQVPQVLPRLIPVSHGSKTQFVLLEELVVARLRERALHRQDRPAVSRWKRSGVGAGTVMGGIAVM